MPTAKWTNRKLPAKIHTRISSGSARPAYNGTIGADELTIDGRTTSGTALLDAIVGKTVYIDAEHLAHFDRLIAFLPWKTLKKLTQYRDWIRAGEYWLRYTGDRDDALFQVRKGNSYGNLINVHRLRRAGPTPLQAVENTKTMLASQGLEAGDLRSPGHVSAVNLRARTPKPLQPPDLHLHRFQNSFRGARFEAATIGRVTCNDYDINSAYPSHIQNLISTTSIAWEDSTDLSNAPYAEYAAVLCDVTINDALRRSPVSYRVYESNLFWPVGKLHKIWLNLPEIKLLLKFPDLGEITRVHQGSWGFVFGAGFRPFHDLVKRFWKLRQAYPELDSYWKMLSNCMFGKFTANYSTRTRKRTIREANKYWNPVYASHITSSITSQLYEIGLGKTVYGEFVDGLTTAEPIKTSQGLGGLRFEGAGDMVIVTDVFKQSAWKQAFAPLVSIMEDNRNAVRLPVVETYPLTLLDCLASNADQLKIGQVVMRELGLPLGSTVRNNGNQYNCGDLLDGAIETAPLRENELNGRIAINAGGGLWQHLADN